MSEKETTKKAKKRLFSVNQNRLTPSPVKKIKLDLSTKNELHTTKSKQFISGCVEDFTGERVFSKTKKKEDVCHIMKLKQATEDNDGYVEEKVSRSIKNEKQNKNDKVKDETEKMTHLKVKKKKKKKHNDTSVELEESSRLILKKKRKKKRKKVSHHEEVQQVITITKEKKKGEKQKQCQSSMAMFKEKAKLASDEIVLNSNHEITPAKLSLDESALEKLDLIDKDFVPEEINPLHIQRITSLYEEHGSTEKHPLFLQMSTRIQDLKKARVKYSTGTWTNRELHILLENIKEFKEKYNIKSFIDFYQTCDISQCHGLDSKYEMYIFLGEGILRLLEGIRSKLNHIYLYKYGANDGTHYTVKEVDKLISLQKKYGCDWKYISTIMNREPRNLMWKFNLLVEDHNIRHNIDDLTKIPDKLTFANSGSTRVKFTKVEDDKIREGVLKFKTKNGRIDWKKVRQYVGTRSRSVLRERWELYLKHNNRHTREKETLETPRNRFLVVVRCLRVFITSRTTDLNDVNWESVTGFIRMKNVMEGDITKQIFYKYLNQHVSDWRNMTIQEMLQYILDNQMHLASKSVKKSTKLQMTEFCKY